MAHRKAGGSTRLGRDSISKRLGVKIFGSQKIKSGNIIVRQRGTKFHPGQNVMKGADDTLFATAEGTVEFKFRKVRDFTGKLVKRRFVSVVTTEEKTEKPKKSKTKIVKAKTKAVTKSKTKATKAKTTKAKK